MAGKTFGEDPSTVIATVLQQQGRREEKPPSKKEQEIIDAIIMSLSAPPGSPAAEVKRRFPSMDEYVTEDASAWPDYEEYLEKLNIPRLRGNPAGLDALLELAPESTNIEDRRGETINDVIRGAMRMYYD